MIRRLPIIPTIVVAAAVVGMVWAGIWNLKRAEVHRHQLELYQSASRLPPITFPTGLQKDDELPLYRYATGSCQRLLGRRTSAGENRAGEPGFLIILDCATAARGSIMSVEAGWSKNPNAQTAWRGGIVSGVIVPDRLSRIRLAAASPAPGLEPGKAAAPAVTVSASRNRGYALQWFAFAAIALVIYGLAVRKRWNQEQPKP